MGGGLRTIVPPRPTPALEDLEAMPRRQASVDAEAIRIVIHDVDSGSASAAQKRVILRRDPSDKAHRSKCKWKKRSFLKKKGNLCKTYLPIPLPVEFPQYRPQQGGRAFLSYGISFEGT